MKFTEVWYLYSSKQHPPLRFPDLQNVLNWPVSCRFCSQKFNLLVFLIGIADHGRPFVQYFLFTKNQSLSVSTFGFVRDLVLRSRNERHGDAIRAICSDNGSEFRNSCFKTFFHDLGLEHQFSSPYTPPHNGVVGRKNITLCEMACSMLDEHRTPRRFWAEASIPLSMYRIGSTLECIRRKPFMS
jgi:hypothetical protein